MPSNYVYGTAGRTLRTEVLEPGQKSGTNILQHSILQSAWVFGN